MSDLKIYFGIDMAKDKFDYCAMDDSLNILCRGSNREKLENAMKSDPVIENHVIMSIPGIGPICISSLVVMMDFSPRSCIFFLTRCDFMSGQGTRS